MAWRRRKCAPDDHTTEDLHPGLMAAGAKSRPRDVRGLRRRRQHGCWDHLIVAPLWVAYDANLGTLLRTCDAVGACMAVPSTPHDRTALARGDTLARRPHVHWLDRSKFSWIARERNRGTHILAVELAEDATPLTLLTPARQRTVVLLGHEHHGVPDEAWPLLDEVVEIPMVGRGASLNVAVAGSLVLYRLARVGLTGRARVVRECRRRSAWSSRPPTAAGRTAAFGPIGAGGAEQHVGQVELRLAAGVAAAELAVGEHDLPNRERGHRATGPVVVPLAGAHEAPLDVGRVDVTHGNGEPVDARLVDHVETLALPDDPIGEIAEDLGRPLGRDGSDQQVGMPDEREPDRVRPRRLARTTGDAHRRPAERADALVEEGAHLVRGPPLAHQAHGGRSCVLGAPLGRGRSRITDEPPGADPARADRAASAGRPTPSRSAGRRGACRRRRGFGGAGGNGRI
jgi:tRNA G18 (ribose-2'-O)-methylase SpoU